MLVNFSISLVVITLAKQHFLGRHYKLFNHVLHFTLYTLSLSLSTLYIAYKYFTLVQPLFNPSINYTTLH